MAIFDGDTAKLRAKAEYSTSRTEYGLPIIKNSHHHVGKNLFLHSRHEGAEEDKLDTCDVEMVDPMDSTVLSANDRMSNNSSTDGTRKRKDGIMDETKAQVKYMRCQFQENSVRENSILFR